MVDPNQRQFGPKLSGRIFKASSGKCFYCRKKLSYQNFEKGDRGAWHADHVRAYGNGGLTTFENGRASCHNCNIKKSDSTHHAFIKKHGGKNGVSKFVRCHGFLKNGKVCSNKAQVTSRQTMYCRRHAKTTSTYKATDMGTKKVTKKPKATKKSSKTKKPKKKAGTFKNWMFYNNM